MKKAILLLLIPFLSYSQEGKLRHIQQYNEVIQKFKVEKDEFYPDKCYYINKAYTGLSGYSKNNLIYPSIKCDSTILLYSKHVGYDIFRVSKLAYKHGDEVIELLPINSECEFTLSKYYSLAVFIIDLPLFKLLSSDPDPKIRIYNEDGGYESLKIQSEPFKDTYLLYQLLQSLGKFSTKDTW